MLRWILFSALLGQVCRAADYQVEANVRYSRHAETVLDILQPRAPALKDRPAAIVIHGRGWALGAKEDVVELLCAPLVARGFVVVSVEYRQVYVERLPAAFIDVREAAAWVVAHAAEYKIDPKRIISVGASVGGELALMTALPLESAGFGPSTKIAAVVNFSGVTDLANQNERDSAEVWLGANARRSDFSPVTYAHKGAPPVLTIQGDADPTDTYELNALLTKRLKEAGSDAETITIKGVGHGFTPEQMNSLWPQVFKWLKKRKIE